MDKRIEYDSLGPVEVDATRYWGAQTQRSLENFRIGTQRQPAAIIHAFAWLKAACADANLSFGKLDEEKCAALQAAGAQVELTIYPGVTHNSWDKAYLETDLIDWLLAKENS